MVCDDTTITLELIKRAQQGREECLSVLAERVRADLLAYLHRLTLDSHLAEDLYQEAMVEMVKHLPRLEITSRRAFWGWLYKIALSKACRQARKRGHSGPSDLLDGLSAPLDCAPPRQLMQRELSEAVCEAVGMLKVSQRNVVALRCFNQLSYAEIAAVTGGTQIQAKLRFFRAKQTLKRHLRKMGFRESHLLPALGLFAALTDPSAGASVSCTAIEAGTLEVGLGTTAVGVLTSKAGLAAVATLAIALASTTGNPSADRIVAGPFGPLTKKMKVPGYVYPSSVVQAYDPDASGWVSVDSTLQGDLVQPTTVEEVLVHDRSLPGRSLLLPSGHWVQVRFPVPITEGPDVDLFLTGYGVTQKPQVALIGPNDERLDLVPSVSRDQPSGFTITAYELSDVDLPFVSYEVRITGVDAGASSPPFALRMVRVGLP